MAIKAISQFDAATPTSNDKILFEQNGEGKSTTLASLPISTKAQAALDAKVNTANVLTLEEIQATTNLTGKVASASSVKDLNEKVLVKGYNLIPAEKVAITDIFCIQNIVFIEGYISSDFGTGIGKTILTLKNGYKLLSKFYAPISCYGGIDGEVAGEKGSNLITINTSHINGEGKFNFFFRVTK